MNRCASSVLFAAAVLLVCAGSAHAQSFPSRPVRLVVPAPPGNTSDAAVRLLGQKMSPILGQPVIVDNRAGASGTIGVSYTLSTAPDGHTLAMISSTSTVAAMHMMKKMPYNPLTDLAPVAGFFQIPTVLVGTKSFAPNSYRELVDYARANPGKARYAYSNATGAVAGASVQAAGNLNLLAVPYKAAAQAITELLGGQIELMFNDVAVTLPHIQAGTVKPYAVTSAKRSPVVPNVPSLSELIPNAPEFVGWAGFIAPPGTPPAVIARLNTVMNDILKTDEMITFLRNMGATPHVFTPQEYADYIRAEEPKWARALKAAGVQPE